MRFSLMWHDNRPRGTSWSHIQCGERICKNYIIFVSMVQSMVECEITCEGRSCGKPNSMKIDLTLSLLRLFWMYIGRSTDDIRIRKTPIS